TPARPPRACPKRPRTRHAAYERDELAPRRSITSSARASSVGGTSSPSALAVLRLITSSNFVGLPDRQFCPVGPFENFIYESSSSFEVVRPEGSKSCSAVVREVPFSGAHFPQQKTHDIGSAVLLYRSKFLDCLTGAVANSYPNVDLLWDNVIAGPWGWPRSTVLAKSRPVTNPSAGRDT